LAFAVGLGQLAFVAVEYAASEFVAAFAAVELAEDRAAVDRVVAVVEQVDGLRHAAQGGERAAKCREVPGVTSERAHQLRAGGLALEQAAGDTEDVLIALADQRHVNSVGRDRSQLSVVACRIEHPEASTAGVAQPRGELKAEQPVEPEHDVGAASSIGHDLLWANAGLRVKQPVEQTDPGARVPGRTIKWIPA